MVEVGRQVLDAVVQRLVPLGGAAAEVVGPGLGRLEAPDQLRRRGRVLQQGLLALERHPQLLLDEVEVAERDTGGAPATFTGRRVAQQDEQRRIAGLVVQGGVVVTCRPLAQHRRHGEHVDRQPGLVQRSPVGSDDVAPARIDVGLRLDQQHPRAPGACGVQERQLALAERLRRVADEQEHLGHAECGCGRRAVGRVEPADAGRVDDGETGLQQLARDRHLDRADTRSIPWVPLLGCALGDALDVDRLARGRAVGGVVHDGRRDVGAVANHRRDHGRHLVGDGAHRGVEQRVDERALALLELACHQDGELVVGDAGRGPVGPLGEVVASRLRRSGAHRGCRGEQVVAQLLARGDRRGARNR